MESIDGTGLPSQQQQPQKPKKWSEIEQESLIYSLPPEQRLPVFDQWVKDTQSYQLQTGGFDNPESFQKFKLKELQTRRRLSSDIGQDPTPEEVNQDYDNYINLISSEQQRLAKQKPDEKAYRDVIDGNRDSAFVGGQIVFSPKVTKDPALYRKAIAESGAPDDIKLIYAGKRAEEDERSIVTRRNELSSKVITPKVASRVVSAIQEGTEILGFDVGDPQSPAIVKNKAGVWSVVDPDYVNWDESIVGGVLTKVLPASDAQYKPMPELNQFQQKYGLTDDEIQKDYLEALKRSAPTSVSRWVTNADSLEDYVPVLNSKVRVLDPDVKAKVFVPNPDLAFDKEAYDAVVDKAKAPEEAKKLAKETRTQIAEAVAIPTFDLLLKNRSDFTDYAKNAKDPQGMVDAVSKYYKDKRDQSWYKDLSEFGSQAIGGIGIGLTRLYNMTNVIPAMFGDVQAAERAAAVQEETNRKSQAMEMVGSRMGMPTTIKLTRDVAAILPDLAAQIALSYATGGLGSAASASALASRTGIQYGAARAAISAAMANAERGAVRTAVSRIPSIAAGSVDDIAEAAIATAKQMSSKNPLKGGLGLQQTVSAATAGLSSMSGTFPEVYSQLRKEGMAPEQALGKARNAAALSGAITGLVTYGFSATGLGGAEDLGTMSRRKAGDFTVRDLVSAGIPELLADKYGRQAVYKAAAGFLGKGRDEGLEEATDQFIGGLSQYLTNPSAEAQDKSVSEVIQESLYAGVLGGVVGAGAGAVGQARRTAGGMTAPQISTEMAGLMPPAAPPAAPPPAAPPAAAAPPTTPPAPAAPTGPAPAPAAPAPAAPPAPGAATLIAPTGTATTSTAAPAAVVSATMLPPPPGATRLAARLASQFGIDISTVTPSGANNTVTPNDIRRAALAKQIADAESAGVEPPVELAPPPPPPNPLLSDAVGMRVQYEGYEGTLIDDNGRVAIQTDDGTLVDVPSTFLENQAINDLGITVSDNPAETRQSILRFYGDTEKEAMTLALNDITRETDDLLDLAELGVSLEERDGKVVGRVLDTEEYRELAKDVTDEQILLAEEQVQSAIEKVTNQPGIPDELKERIISHLEGNLDILSLFIETRDAWENGSFPRYDGQPTPAGQAQTKAATAVTAGTWRPAAAVSQAQQEATAVADSIAPVAPITAAALQQAANTAVAPVAPTAAAAPTAAPVQATVTPTTAASVTPAQAQAPAAPTATTAPSAKPAGEIKSEPAKLTDVEKKALALTKLKGAEQRTTEITFIPEKLMTPERLRSIKTEKELRQMSDPRGGKYIEVKRYGDVIGDPTKDGWVVIDRRAKITEREAAAAPKKPEAAQSAAEEALVAAEPAAAPKKPVEKKQRRLAKDQVETYSAPITGLPEYIDPALKSKMYPIQVDGANAVIDSLEKNGAALNGDGTGVGKTRQIIAVAKHYADKGEKVFIISKNDALGKPFERTPPSLTGSMEKDSADMGVSLELLLDQKPKAGKIYVTAYHKIKAEDIPSDAVIIFDEAAEIANVFGEKPNSKAVGEYETKFRKIISSAKKIAYFTATPGDKPHQFAYLHKVLGFPTANDYLIAAQAKGMETKKNPRSGKEKSKSRQSTLDWIESLTEKAGKEGRYIKREISYEGVVVQFQDVNGTSASNTWSSYYSDAMNRISEKEETGWRISESLKELVDMYAAELTKIGAAVDILENELNDGRSVVIFVSRINPMDVEMSKSKSTGSESTITKEKIFSLESPVDLLRAELKKKGIKFSELHGESTEKASKVQSDFQEGKAKVIIASVESGGTGINLDDTVGNNPRTIIYTFAPYRAVSLIQANGRIWRSSTIQDDNNPTKIIMVTATNLAQDLGRMGVLERKLKFMKAAVGGDAIDFIPLSDENIDMSKFTGLNVTSDIKKPQIETARTQKLKPGSTEDGTPDPNTEDDVSVNSSTGRSYTPGEARKAGITRIAADLGIVNGDQQSVFTALRNISRTGNRRHRKVAKDLLSRLEGTDVTVSMISVDPAKNGWFDPQTGVVYLNLDGPHETGLVETLLHELVHGGTERAIRNPVTPAQKALVDSLQQQMDTARKAAEGLIKSKLGKNAGLTDWRGLVDQARRLNDYDFFDIVYGLSSLSEFATHGTTSKAFQKFLSGVGKDGKPLGMFDRFVRAIAKFFTGQTDMATDVYRDIISLIGAADKGSVRMPNLDRTAFNEFIGAQESTRRGFIKQLSAAATAFSVAGCNMKNLEELIMDFKKTVDSDVVPAETIQRVNELAKKSTKAKVNTKQLTEGLSLFLEQVDALSSGFTLGKPSERKLTTNAIGSNGKPITVTVADVVQSSEKIITALSDKADLLRERLERINGIVQDITGVDMSGAEIGLYDSAGDNMALIAAMTNGGGLNNAYTRIDDSVARLHPGTLAALVSDNNRASMLAAASIANELTHVAQGRKNQSLTVDKTILPENSIKLPSLVDKSYQRRIKNDYTTTTTPKIERESFDVAWLASKVFNGKTDRVVSDKEVLEMISQAKNSIIAGPPIAADVEHIFVNEMKGREPLFSQARSIIDQQLSLYAPDLKVFVEPNAGDAISFDGLRLVVNQDMVDGMDADDIRLQTQRAAVASRVAGSNALASEIIQKPNIISPALIGDRMRADVARVLMSARDFAAANGMQPLALDLGSRADLFGATAMMLGSEARGVTPEMDARYADLEAKNKAKTISAEEKEEAQTLVNNAAMYAAESASKPFNIEDKTFGARYRGMEGYGIWMTPSGRVLPVDNHSQFAKEFFREKNTDYGVQSGFGQKWIIVRAIKGGQYIADEDTLYVETSGDLSNAQRKNLKDWAAFHGYNLSVSKSGVGFPLVTFTGVPLSKRFNPQYSEARYSEARGIADQDKSTYSEIGLSFESMTEDEKGVFEKVQSPRFGKPRNPWLAVLAMRMRSGEITPEQYSSAAKTVDPFVIKGAEQIPSDEKIRKYMLVSEPKPPKDQFESKLNKIGADVDSGKLVEVRIDIPTYNASSKANDPTYAVTIHEPVNVFAGRVGEPISYVGAAKVKNPEFITRSISGKGDASMIAAGSGKTPLATVRGTYEQVTKLPDDISDQDIWTEVGYNPIRSSSFIDVRSGLAVTGGTEAIMVGSRVFVKDATLVPVPTGIDSSGKQFQFSTARGTGFGITDKTMAKLRSRGFMTQETLDTVLMSESEKKAAADAARFLGQNLLVEIKKTFGKKTADTRSYRVFYIDGSGKLGFTSPQASLAAAEKLAAASSYPEFVVATPEELMNIALGNNAPSLTVAQENDLLNYREKSLKNIQDYIDSRVARHNKESRELIAKAKASGAPIAEIDKLTRDRAGFIEETIRRWQVQLDELMRKKYERMTEKFMNLNRQQFLIKQASMKRFLPDNILEEVEAARAAIDGRSKDIAGIDFLMDKGMMRVVFDSNEGLYVTRAYDAFEAKNRADYVEWAREAYNKMTDQGSIPKADPLASERVAPLVRVLTGRIIERRAKDAITEQNDKLIDEVEDELSISSYPFSTPEFTRGASRREVLTRRMRNRNEFIRGIAIYLKANPALLRLPPGASKRDINNAAMAMGREAYNDPDSYDKLITDSGIDRIRLLKYKLMTMSEAMDLAQFQYNTVETLRRSGKPDTTGIKWRPSIGNGEGKSFIEALNSDFQKNLDFILGAPVSASSAAGENWKKLGDEILMHRGNVPDYMRKFWGETDSPIQRITQTITKQGVLAANGHFRETIAALGLSQGWAVRKADYDKNPTMYDDWKLLIKGDEDYEGNPLSGIYVNPDMYNSLEIRTAGNQPTNNAFKFIGAWVGTALWNATSGLMRGATRNLASFPNWAFNAGQNLANPLALARTISNFGLAAGAVSEHLATVPKVKGGAEGDSNTVKFTKDAIATIFQGYSFSGAGTAIFKGVSKGFTAASDITGRIDEKPTKKQYQDLYVRSVKYGVADNNIERNDLARLLNYEDEITRRPLNKGKLQRLFPSWLRPDKMEGALDFVVQTGKATMGNRTEYYSSMDSLTKITLWLSEMEEQAKIHAKDDAEFQKWRGATGMFTDLPEDLQKKAADIIGNTVQSDSRVIEGVNQFRKAGWGKILSPFLASKVEFIRTFGNAYRIAFDEMANGVNEKEKARGARRLFSAILGHTLYASVASALAVMVMRAVGGGDDEENEGVTLDSAQIDGLRKLLPGWAQGKVLAARAYKNGEIDWADVSFQLPFGWTNELLTSGRMAYAKRGENDATSEIALSVIRSMMSDFIGNFASRQIAIEAASNAFAGFDRVRNKVIWEDDDNVFKKINKGLQYYMNSAGYPGDVRDAIKMYKAAYGIEENGSKYKMDAVLLSMATGQSIRTQKIDDMYLAQMRQAQDDLRTVNRSLYASALRDANNVDPESVAEDTKLAVRRHTDIMQGLGRMYKSATELLEVGGMDSRQARNKINSVMRSEEVKLSQRNERAIMYGYVPPWRASEVTEREMRMLDRKYNDGRFQAYLDAVRR